MPEKWSNRDNCLEVDNLIVNFLIFRFNGDGGIGNRSWLLGGCFKCLSGNLIEQLSFELLLLTCIIVYELE